VETAKSDNLLQKLLGSESSSLEKRARHAIRPRARRLLAKGMHSDVPVTPYTKSGPAMVRQRSQRGRFEINGFRVTTGGLWHRAIPASLASTMSKSVGGQLKGNKRFITRHQDINGLFVFRRASM
jgi:hypothetical protein